MKSRVVVVMAMGLAWMAAFAAADGSWLKKVPAADHARVNPVAGDAAAIAAGANLFANNCAKCHGAAGVGRDRGRRLKVRASPARAMATSRGC